MLMMMMMMMVVIISGTHCVEIVFIISGTHCVEIVFKTVVLKAEVNICPSARSCLVLARRLPMRRVAMMTAMMRMTISRAHCVEIVRCFIIHIVVGIMVSVLPLVLLTHAVWCSMGCADVVAPLIILIVVSIMMSMLRLVLPTHAVW